MTPSPHEQWSVIVTMTEAMLSHAEADEWLELAALENQRRELITKHMRVPTDDSGIEIYTRLLQRILDLDGRIKVLAQNGRATLAKQLQTLGQGRSAMQAYAQQQSR